MRFWHSWDSNFLKPTVFIFAGVALLLGHAREVKADSIIYSNLGPGETHDQHDYYSVSGGGQDFVNGFGAALAESFTPTSNFVFSSMELALGLVPGGLPITNAFTVKLMSDDAGHPGSTLEAFSITGLPVYPSSGIEQFTSTIHTPLSEGTTYWVAAFPVAGDSYGGWYLNATGAAGISKIGNDGVTWTAYTDPSAAFEVDGQAVPEPATLTLVGIGTLGLLGYARRRRKTVPA